VPNLQGIEASGMPLQPFMKLLSIAVLSFADNVGIFSAVLPFEFGRVYIKQENREEISLKLEEDSITEMIGPAAYPEWDRRKLQEFLLQTLDNYFQRIEEDYQAWEDNKS